MKPVTSRESVDCKRVEDYAEAVEHGPGAFYFENDDKQMTIIMPGRHTAAVHFTGAHRWNWDGNREAPTIDPSILGSTTWGKDREYIELWHGFMKAGRLESC